MITQKRLQELLDYNPATGIIAWATNRVRARAGDEAGYLRKNGYRVIQIDGAKYYAHRVAWSIIHNDCPEFIDHINHNPSDNRIINLREVTHQENCKNQSVAKNNVSGCSGVGKYSQSGKYRSRITHKGKEIHLGLFGDFFEACCARKSAENKYAFHGNHGAC